MTKIKVLTIDDEQDTLDLLKTFLEMFECEVTTAMTGMDGLKLSSTTRPDVVILDLMLPDADGFQICRLIRHQDVTRKTPVLILSARQSNDDEVHGYRAGATVYLRKPVDLNVLVEQVRRVYASGHIAPPGYEQPIPAPQPTASGNLLGKPLHQTDEARVEPRPALKNKPETLHIPGLYIPRDDDDAGNQQ
jgi:DNA-binding response OmpR family regulator